jgi:two-component system OmpR family sensor kinase
MLLAIAAAAIGTYLRARDDANALFDYQLKEMAASLTDAPFAGAPSITSGGKPSAETMVVQIWDQNGVQLFMSQPHRVLPQHAQLGFTTIDTDSGRWRIFSTLSGGQVVQVAQPMSARSELAASLALHAVIPLLAIMPFLGVLIWYTIAHGLRPLDRVAADLRQRSPAQLQPLPETNLPREVQPLVHALNALLDRLREALSAQRAFIADAAHELRTPLTAVHLQAQLAERAPDGPERQAALAELKGGLERATRLSEQLVALAREEPGMTERDVRQVDLAQVARDVVAEQAPLAGAKRIDLGADAVEPIRVRGDPGALTTLVSNLVDNALRYTPDGGRIDVEVRRDGKDALLRVADTGPGISAEDASRVFDRFYRGAAAQGPAAAHGSGLGLAIVRRIAEHHGAHLELGSGLDGQGLGVSVRFASVDGADAAAVAAPTATTP